MFNDLIYLLRARSSGDYLPDYNRVKRSIEKYIEFSKYLDYNGNNIDISPKLDNLFIDWNNDVKSVI